MEETTKKESELRFIELPMLSIDALKEHLTELCSNTPTLKERENNKVAFPGHNFDSIEKAQEYLKEACALEGPLVAVKVKSVSESLREKLDHMIWDHPESKAALKEVSDLTTSIEKEEEILKSVHQKVLYELYERYEHHVPCGHCDSKINKKYIKAIECGICGQPLIPATLNKRYKETISLLNKNKGSLKRKREFLRDLLWEVRWEIARKLKMEVELWVVGYSHLPNTNEEFEKITN